MKRSRSIFICILLSFALLAAFIGCPDASAPPTPGSGPVPGVQPGVTTTEGVVLPLEPTGVTPPKPTAEEKKIEAPKDGAFLVPAGVYGKVAAEAVPMPPVEDLAAQIDEYVAKIGATLDDLDGTVNYKSDGDQVVRDANGLALVALAVGMMPVDSKYKKAAPAIIQAATDLAKIDKYDDAKKGYETLRAALTTEGDPSTLRWTKVADLTPVMKAVPNLSSMVKRLTNAEPKLKRAVKKPERLYGATAALAAISHGSIANAADTNKPNEVELWKKECELFRDAAIQANAALHGYADGKIDYAAYWEAHTRMTDACETCHKIFSPGAVGKSE